MTAACELLPWDTEFFGVRVARITAGHLGGPDFRDVDAWCRQQAIDCAYFLADTRSAEEHASREEAGFRLVDGRVTLEARVEAALSPSPTGVRLARIEDLPALRAIAETSHRDTRFYTDPRFGAAAARLYGCWIEKSVREADTTVLVPDEPVAVGYITCYQAGESVGQIGLLGVAETARGRGLGRRLVMAALAWCRSRSLSHARVVTQAGNLGGLGVYTVCGFTIVSTQWWYHRWFTDRSAA
jgi:dTDP-4-amino-4,6-dideoxy-D-galactose acyltransferase